MADMHGTKRAKPAFPSVAMGCASASKRAQPLDIFILMHDAMPPVRSSSYPTLPYSTAVYLLPNRLNLQATFPAVLVCLLKNPILLGSYANVRCGMQVPIGPRLLPLLCFDSSSTFVLTSSLTRSSCSEVGSTGQPYGCDMCLFSAEGTCSRH